jgi:hypothetical protein
VIGTVKEAAQRENLLGVTQILAGLRFDEKMLEGLFRAEGKMIESPVLTKWFRQRDIAAYHRAILEGLEVRFGPAPDDVSAAVRVIGDEARVVELHKASYVCSSLDEFRRALGIPTPPATAPTN